MDDGLCQAVSKAFWRVGSGAARRKWPPHRSQDNPLRRILSAPWPQRPRAFKPSRSYPWAEVPSGSGLTTRARPDIGLQGDKDISLHVSPGPEVLFHPTPTPLSSQLGGELPGGSDVKNCLQCQERLGSASLVGYPLEKGTVLPTQ